MIEPDRSESRLSEIEDPYLSLAHQELKHRVDIAKRGQNFAFAALILVLATTLSLGLAHHDVLAGAIGGAYLVSVVGLFITGRYSDPRPATPSPSDPQVGQETAS
jgi:hypothetical protein